MTIDIDRLRQWLTATVESSITDVSAIRLGGGNSSGAWRLDITAPSGPRSLVLKSPNDGGLVFDCDASREGRILDAAGRAGAPVPVVAAIDESGGALGQPCSVMEFVDGRSVPESTPASFHGDGWFRDADESVQRAVWWSFLDALGAVHAIDVDAMPARYGSRGVVDVLHYWRRSLLDAAPAHLVPRQLSVIDWLTAHIPPDADDEPALCMGDSRLGNALLKDTEVRALIDFEVAYIGNPAADIGYCLMHEAFTRLLTDRPASGIPSVEETWNYWEKITGRTVRQRDYWTAFGATVLCVTGTRAMLKWGMPLDSIDNDNIVVGEWEALIERASDC
jgi:aminoglycoside phosphotransferase (APT) family kinase protein